MLLMKLYCESAEVYSSTMEDWRREQLLKITEFYKPKNIYNADWTGLFFRIPPNKTLSWKGSSCHYGKNSQKEDNCFVCFVSIQSQWGS
jgi:hypothetical protein